MLEKYRECSRIPQLTERPDGAVPLGQTVARIINASHKSFHGLSAVFLHGRPRSGSNVSADYQ
jgi:hypothetical protein